MQYNRTSFRLMFIICHFLLLQNLLVSSIISYPALNKKSFDKTKSKETSQRRIEQRWIWSIEDDNEEVKHATICVYEESSCALRNQGEPGTFIGCNREIPGEMCLNFPTAGVMFKCTANDVVETYPTGNCEANEGVSHQVACLDVSASAYFLLCCTEETQTGEMCSISSQLNNNQEYNLWNGQTPNRLRGN